MERHEVIHGVTDTLHDYCQFVDEARIDDIAGLFCDDAVFDDGNPAIGHEKVIRRIRRLLASVEATSHHLTNIRVEPEHQPDFASASSYCYAWHQRSDGSQFELWIRYVDRLRFQQGRWRLLHRAIESSGFRGLESFPVPKVKRRPLDLGPGTS